MGTSTLTARSKNLASWIAQPQTRHTMSPKPRLTSSRFNTSSFMTSDGCVSAKASAGARGARARMSTPASFVNTSLEAARTSVAERKEREQQY